MYRLLELKNGLKIVTEKIDYVNSVSVGLWVENGSRNESPEFNGISHFIEHMLFKGTKRRTAKEIAEAIEEVGGQINAFTGKEATCFYIKALDTHLDLALDILSDMLFNSNFEEGDIEKEKSVVVEEIGMTEDNPEDVLSDLHSEAIWGKDPISSPILGTVDTVRSFTRDTILQYLSNYYIPENSVISIAGKFDENEMEKMVESYFGEWSSTNKKITAYSSPTIFTNVLKKEKEIEQLHMSLGVRGIEIGNDELYPLLLLNNVLGGGASSILFQRIREELGLCYTIYSYISSYKNTGVVNIYTGVNPAYGAKALENIIIEVDKFVKQGLKEERIQKGKEQLKGSYVLGLESTSSRMFGNGKSILFLNRVNTPKDVLEKIDKINMESIHNVLIKTFGQGILNGAFVGKKIDSSEYEAILKNQAQFAHKNEKSIYV